MRWTLFAIALCACTEPVAFGPPQTPDLALDGVRFSRTRDGVLVARGTSRSLRITNEGAETGSLQALRVVAFSKEGAQIQIASLEGNSYLGSFLGTAVQATLASGTTLTSSQMHFARDAGLAGLLSTDAGITLSGSRMTTVARSGSFDIATERGSVEGVLSTLH